MGGQQEVIKTWLIRLITLSLYLAPHGNLSCWLIVPSLWLPRVCLCPCFIGQNLSHDHPWVQERLENPQAEQHVQYSPWEGLCCCFSTGSRLSQTWCLPVPVTATLLTPALRFPTVCSERSFPARLLLIEGRHMCVEKIRRCGRTFTGRRRCPSLWVSDLPAQAVTSCHVCFQFFR